VNHEDAFLQDVVEHPEDDAPRLVYSDWLEENGRPERAEFIRAGCAMEKLSPADPERDKLAKRSAEIEKKHAKEWIRPLKAALGLPRCKQLGRRGWTFRRGFVERLSLTPMRVGFLTAAHEFLRRTPVRDLTLTGHPGALAELADSSCLRALRRLWLCGGSRPTAESMRILGSSPNLPRLAELSLVLDVPAAVIAGLAGTLLAGRLDYLSMPVRREELSGVLDLLTNSPAFPALSGLGTPMSPDLMSRLANAPHPPALRRLHLYSGVNGPCIDELLGSPLWGRLTELHLIAIDPEAGRLVIEVLPECRLRSLGMTYGRLNGAHVAALVGLPAWGTLEG
jgi:uncharacterized protein (TIGR02996 family)